MEKMHYIFIVCCIFGAIMTLMMYFRTPRFPVVLMVDNRQYAKFDLTDHVLEDTRWSIVGIVYIDPSYYETLDTSVVVCQKTHDAFIIVKKFFHNDFFEKNDKVLIVIPSPILMTQEVSFLDETLADNTYLILIADSVERWISPEKELAIPGNTNLVYGENDDTGRER